MTGRHNAYLPEVDGRANQRKKTLYFRNVSVLYGERPQDSEVWLLSPYEFVTHWQPALASFPQSLADADDERHHVILTERGKEKLLMQGKHKESATLEPGDDYVVKEKGGDDWIPYPAGNSTDYFRHSWIIRRRRRPKAPSFHGSPLPKHRNGEAENAAKYVMAYFKPYFGRGEMFDAL